MLRASTKAYAQFRKLQEDLIRRNGREQQSDSDAASVSDEEVTDDEFEKSPVEERRPITRVLQLVLPVETRWNSTFYMMQR